MAGDVCHRACRVADRISATEKANDRLRMFQFEQCAMGDLGSARARLRADRFAILPLPDESSRIQQELQGPVKLETLRHPRAVEIFSETSGVHAQKDTLKDDPCIGFRVKSPNNPHSITCDEAPKAIIRRRGRCEPINQAEITVTTIVGLCKKSMFSNFYPTIHSC